MHIIGSWMNVGVDEIAQFLITDNLLLVLRSLRQAVLVILGLPKKFQLTFFVSVCFFCYAVHLYA